MSTDIDVLNFYTKGKSIIRGSFPVSVNDQNACNVSTKTITEQNVFIDEGISGNDGGNGDGCGICTGYCFSPFTDGNENYYTTKTIVNNGATIYSNQVASSARFSTKYFKEYNDTTLKYGGLGLSSPYGQFGYFYTDTISYNVEKYQYYTSSGVLTNRDWSGYLNINHILLGGFYGVNDYYIDNWNMNISTWLGANDPTRSLVNGSPYWDISETQSANRGGSISNTSGIIKWGAGDLTYSVVANLLPYGTGSGGQFLVNYAPTYAPSMSMGNIIYKATGVMQLC